MVRTDRAKRAEDREGTVAVTAANLQYFKEQSWFNQSPETRISLEEEIRKPLSYSQVNLTSANDLTVVTDMDRIQESENDVPNRNNTIVTGNDRIEEVESEMLD